jgi:hypothetical protein
MRYLLAICFVYLALLANAQDKKVAHTILGVWESAEPKYGGKAKSDGTLHPNACFQLNSDRTYVYGALCTRSGISYPFMRGNFEYHHKHEWIIFYNRIIDSNGVLTPVKENDTLSQVRFSANKLRAIRQSANADGTQTLSKVTFIRK